MDAYIVDIVEHFSHNESEVTEAVWKELVDIQVRKIQGYYVSNGGMERKYTKKQKEFQNDTSQILVRILFSDPKDYTLSAIESAAWCQAKLEAL